MRVGLVLGEGGREWRHSGEGGDCLLHYYAASHADLLGTCVVHNLFSRGLVSKQVSGKRKSTPHQRHGPALA
jgi:hypothetical protein